MASVKVNRRKKPASILVTGDLTIDSVAEVHSGLLPLLEIDAVTIRFEDVSHIDLAALQLLVAFDRSAAQSGCRLEWEECETLDRFVRMAEFAGIRPPGKVVS